MEKDAAGRLPTPRHVVGVEVMNGCPAGPFRAAEGRGFTF